MPGPRADMTKRTHRQASPRRPACRFLPALALALLAAAATYPSLAASPALAAESDPKPVPEGGARAKAIADYNDGVALMLRREFAKAQAKFEAALTIDATLAEAHNNLAFSLRAQGPANHQRALGHYNRAIELKPALAQAYMYRGVLFTLMGDLERARADHARLLPLDARLAARLAEAIASFPMVDTYDGLAPQFD